MKDIFNQVQRKLQPKWCTSENHKFVNFCQKHVEEKTLQILHSCGKLFILSFNISFKNKN